jgi:hypothetical protein
MARIRWGFPLLLLASSIGCGPVSRPRLLGEWKATYSWGVHRVRLQQGGSYEEDVLVRAPTEDGARSQGTERIVNSGAWQFWAERGFPRIGRVVLLGCLDVDDGRGGLNPQPLRKLTQCSYPVEREFVFGPQVRLGPDGGRPYLLKQR